MRWWDVAGLLPVERDLFPHDPWTAELFWSELALAPARRHYVVAESGPGEPLGYAGLSTAGGEADVQTVAVRRDAQGRGVGAALLAELLAEARRRGCASVTLDVRADDPRARALYARFGFAEIGVRRGYYAGGSVDALVMRRRGADG